MDRAQVYHLRGAIQDIVRHASAATAATHQTHDITSHVCPHRSTGPSLTPPLCDILSGYCSFTGPWTVTRSSLRMLRQVATFCRPLRPALLLVSFPHSRSPVVGVLGLC